MDYVTVEDRIASAAAAGADGAAAAKSKRRSGSGRRIKKAHQNHRSQKTVVMEKPSAHAELTEMPIGHPRLESAMADVPVMEAVMACGHCGDRRLETEPPCGCDSVIAEYGSTGCDCCGYSYMDSRGMRESPSSATSGFTLLYYEQYGWWIREPCAACSTKFVEHMRAVQKADLWHHEAEKEWEFEQMCRWVRW